MPVFVVHGVHGVASGGVSVSAGLMVCGGRGVAPLPFLKFQLLDRGHKAADNSSSVSMNEGFRTQRG